MKHFKNILLPLRIFVIYLLLKEYWIFQQILYIGEVRRRLFYILYGSERLRYEVKIKNKRQDSSWGVTLPLFVIEILKIKKPYLLQSIFGIVVHSK